MDEDEQQPLTDQLAAILPEVTGEMVACGIVVENWRDAIEPLHRFLHDHEMAYINIGTTIAVARFCTPHSVEWPGVWATLRDPDRVLLPGRTAKQIAGRDWRRFRAAITERLKEAEGRPAIAYAGWAQMICPQWWGMPAYAAQVDRLVASHRVTRWAGNDAQLAETLLRDPLSVPLQVWEQIVGGNGFGWADA